ATDGATVLASLVEFPIPTPNSQPSRITAGADGNLWFAETAPGGSRVARITLAGVVTEFPILPAANAGVVDLTAGPDGNIWFTERDASKIGRITPDGT